MFEVMLSAWYGGGAVCSMWDTAREALVA